MQKGDGLWLFVNKFLMEQGGGLEYARGGPRCYYGRSVAISPVLAVRDEPTKRSLSRSHLDNFSARVNHPTEQDDIMQDLRVAS